MTNDTTRTDVPWRAAHERAHEVINDLCHGTIHWTMSVPARESKDPDLILGNTLRLMATEIAARDAELLRLAGPICPHDGKRATEHALVELESCGGQQDGEPCLWPKRTHDDGFVLDHAWSWLHPEWPEGAAWLVEHAR